jgi:hypothetical protein
MDRDQVIEEARRLADQGDYEAACVLLWLSVDDTQETQARTAQDTVQAYGLLTRPRGSNASYAR